MKLTIRPRSCGSLFDEGTHNRKGLRTRSKSCLSTARGPGSLKKWKRVKQSVQSHSLNVMLHLFVKHSLIFSPLSDVVRMNILWWSSLRPAVVSEEVDSGHHHMSEIFLANDQFQRGGVVLATSFLPKISDCLWFLHTLWRDQSSQSI